jgi:hypothetical protein
MSPDVSEAELKKRTLTNLCSQRPTWLDLAHRKLYAAVFNAYDWPHDLSDEEILERLLALNLERQGLSPKSEALAVDRSISVKEFICRIEHLPLDRPVDNSTPRTKGNFNGTECSIAGGDSLPR